MGTWQKNTYPEDTYGRDDVAMDTSTLMISSIDMSALKDDVVIKSKTQFRSFIIYYRCNVK